MACETVPAAAEDSWQSDAAATHEAATPANPDSTHQPTSVDLQSNSHTDANLLLDGFTLDEAMLVKSPLLPYLAMIASVIERRSIHYEELLQVLLRGMRQRSFDRLPRREYVLRFLKQHPP